MSLEQWEKVAADEGELLPSEDDAKYLAFLREVDEIICELPA